MLIELSAFGDERGFFCETYRHNVFSELGIEEPTVQDNHSCSRRGIVRGDALSDRSEHFPSDSLTASVRSGQ